MASNRFRVENAYRLVAALRERGIDPGATLAPWYLGCSDYDCCPQQMLSIETRVSTRALLRLAAELGLTPIH